MAMTERRPTLPVVHCTTRTGSEALLGAMAGERRRGVAGLARAARALQEPPPPADTQGWRQRAGPGRIAALRGRTGGVRRPPEGRLAPAPARRRSSARRTVRHGRA